MPKLMYYISYYNPYSRNVRHHHLCIRGMVSSLRKTWCFQESPGPRGENRATRYFGVKGHLESLLCNTRWNIFQGQATFYGHSLRNHWKRERDPGTQIFWVPCKLKTWGKQISCLSSRNASKGHPSLCTGLTQWVTAWVLSLDIHNKINEKL